MTDHNTLVVLHQLINIVDWSLDQLEALGHATISCSVMRGKQRELDQLRQTVVAMEKGLLEHTHMAVRTEDLAFGAKTEYCSCGAGRVVSKEGATAGWSKP